MAEKERHAGRSLHTHRQGVPFIQIKIQPLEDIMAEEKRKVSNFELNVLKLHFDGNDINTIATKLHTSDTQRIETFLKLHFLL